LIRLGSSGESPTVIILFTWYADAIQRADVAAAGTSVVVSKSNPAALQTRLDTLFEAA